MLSPKTNRTNAGSGRLPSTQDVCAMSRLDCGAAGSRTRPCSTGARRRPCVGDFAPDSSGAPRLAARGCAAGGGSACAERRRQRRRRVSRQHEQRRIGSRAVQPVCCGVRCHRVDFRSGSDGSGDASSASLTFFSGCVTEVFQAGRQTAGKSCHQQIQQWDAALWLITVSHCTSGSLAESAVSYVKHFSC